MRENFTDSWREKAVPTDWVAGGGLIFPRPIEAYDILGYTQQIMRMGFPMLGWPNFFCTHISLPHHWAP